MDRVIRALVPVVIWMAIIFCMSTDVASSAHTSRIIEPLLRWLIPGISTAHLDMVHEVIRKCGHVTEYSIMALLILRALRSLRATPATLWSWSLAGWALLGSAAYAASDEFHQTFVPSRGPAVHDVVLDSAAAGLALLVAFWWNRRRAAAMRVAQA